MTSASRTSAVQVATKAAADRTSSPAVTHYCSSTAMATVDVFHEFGLPVVVWGAVLPDITYRNKYQGGASRQRHDDQPERSQRGADARPGTRRWVVIHDTTDYGKGHNKYFSAAHRQGGGQVARHLRRHRRPAGLHRRAHPDQGAQSRGHLLRRPDTHRRPHPRADGQARHQRACSRGRRASSRMPIIKGLGPAGRRHAGVPRGGAGGETSRRQVLHRKVHRSRNTTIPRRPTAPSLMPRWT